MFVFEKQLFQLMLYGGYMSKRTSLRIKFIFIFATGGQTHEEETLLFLLLASVGVSVQISMLGPKILLTFGRTFGQI